MANLNIVSAMDQRKFKNAEHVQFHTNVRSLIEKADTEKVGLSDLVFNPYNAAIAAEQDIVNKAYGSVCTPQMESWHKERILVFRRIRHKLQIAGLESPETEAYKAYPTLKRHLIDQYKSNVANLPYQELTATITGFVMDAREMVEPEVIEALGIDSDLDDLQATNRKFGAAYQDRIIERAQNMALASNDLRVATDDAYAALVITLNSLANDPNPANKTKVEAAQQLVTQLNVLITEARNRVNQRLSKKDSAGSEGGSGSGSTGGTGSTGIGGSGGSTGTGGSTGNTGTSGTTGNSGTSGTGTNTQKPVTPPDDDVME